MPPSLLFETQTLRGEEGGTGLDGKPRASSEE